MISTHLHHLHSEYDEILHFEYNAKLGSARNVDANADNGEQRWRTTQRERLHYHFTNEYVHRFVFLISMANR